MKKILDRTFERIITLLQKNARLSNKELAAQIGLAPSTCLERMRSLHEAGVFKGFHADVDPKVLGIHLQAMVAVRLATHSRDTLEAFKAHVISLPEVHAVYHMAGVNDFFLHVTVRDSDHLLELNLNNFSTHPEVAHIETSVIFEYQRNPVLPSYLEFPK
ncbi:MAG: Lrp/AsnC family transcriptional regulator [Rhodothermales bacterium]